MFVTLFAFVTIGILAALCVGFGVTEISLDDRVLGNAGLGEVLTTLGLYFSVPYLFILVAFAAVTNRLQWLAKLLSRIEVSRGAWALVLLLYLTQQVVTNIYLTILYSPAVLGIVALDVAVLATVAAMGVRSIAPGVAYTAMFALKAILLYQHAPATASQSVFGSNGAYVMLFLCIPMIHIPLYITATDAMTEANGGFVEQFATNFNLYLTHLLHALDAISLFSVGFIPTAGEGGSVGEDLTTPLPPPFRALIIALIVVAFVANNVCMLLIFFESSWSTMVQPLLGLARVAVSPVGFSGSFDTTSLRALDSTSRGASNRRLRQYMLAMMVLADAPMLVTRLVLWFHVYAPLSVFVAKNIKDIVDVFMMYLRADIES